MGTGLPCTRFVGGGQTLMSEGEGAFLGVGEAPPPAI